MVKKSYHGSKPYIFLQCLSVLNIFFSFFFFFFFFFLCGNFVLGSDLIGNKLNPNLHSGSTFFKHFFNQYENEGLVLNAVSPNAIPVNAIPLNLVPLSEAQFKKSSQQHLFIASFFLLKKCLDTLYKH